MMAAFSRHAEALAWARDRAATVCGPLVAASEPFVFEETDYYRAEMGPGLRKQLLAFAGPFDPARLPEWKLRTNEWELEYAKLGRHAEPRPLNLDPGYLALGKFVLASTKDHAHRLYLRDGIYAEVTLQYRDRHWQPQPWTFPDYRRVDYHAFLDHVRDLLRQQLRQESSA